MDAETGATAARAASGTSNDSPIAGRAVDEFKLKITATVEDELNCFVRYTRLGLFQDAKDTYDDGLKNFEHLFEVTAERADHLFERGMYGEVFEFLNQQLALSYVRGFKENEVALLRLWKALASLHQGELRGALGVARHWRRSVSEQMTTESLSVVDNLSLATYLRIVTAASINSNWLVPEDTQPPWETKGSHDWSGFCYQFNLKASDASGAWDARSLFLSLLTVVSLREATGLYDNWRAQRDRAAEQPGFETDEGDLLADLSITTTYERHLLIGAAGNNKTHDQALGLHRKSGQLLDELNELVGEVDELHDRMLRPELELNLAEQEKDAAISSDTDFYLFRDLERSRLKTARKNLDKITQVNFLRIQCLNWKRLSMNYRWDHEIFLLLDEMQDSMGYLTAATNMILSTFKVSTREAQQQGLSYAAMRSRISYEISSMLVSMFGTHRFDLYLTRALMNAPKVRFEAFVAQLIVAEYTKSKYPERKEREKKKIQFAKAEIQKVLPDLPMKSLYWIVGLGGGDSISSLADLIPDQLNSRDNANQTPLAIAIQNQDLPAVRLLLKKGPGGQITEPDKPTPVFEAVREGDVDLVQKLLDHTQNLKVDEENESVLGLLSQIAGGIVEQRISEFLDVK